MAPVTRATAVLFDAYGTLFRLDDPVGRLRDGLAAEGYGYPARAVERAFREEVAYYRHHLDRGRDAASLRELRRDCAEVFARALPGGPPPPVAVRILVGALRYRLFPDVLPALDALRARGCALGVVSNWDASLEETLDVVGILPRFRAVVASAVVGARKPAAAPFRAALDALTVAPSDAVYVGNEPDVDGVGAAAAGLRVIIVDRDGRHGTGGWRTVAALTDVSALLPGEPPGGQ